MSNEIVTVDGELVEQRAPMTLFGTDNPEAVVERASAVATSLGAVIEQRSLYSNISGKKHTQVEGWTLLGSMLGVFAEVEWSRPLENGWEARAVARTLAGQVVGAAEAMCTTSENRWRRADDYAVRSMAQTRAVSKALRMPLGFIMHLAGYSATPAEEIADEQPERSERANPGREQPARTSAPVQRTPEEQQLRNRALDLAVERYGDGVNVAMKRLADEVGVPKGESATVDQLHQIIALIEQPPAQAAADGASALARETDAPTTPPSEGHPDLSGSEVATTQAGEVADPGGTSPAASAQPTFDDILEATGGVEVPPEPGTPEYKALPTGADRAKARAYWEAEKAPA